MRILLAARRTSVGKQPVGGVQTWVDTVDAELRRRGHNTKIWEPGVGFRGRFDVGIFAHTRETGEMIAHCDKSVGVIHGIVPLEEPSAHLRPDVTLAVSESVAEAHGGADGIIRQPIDIGFWTPDHPDDPIDRVLTRFSYRRHDFLSPRVAAHVGLEHRHLREGTHEQLLRALRRSTAVLATGRAALEAAACGRPVVIYDWRSEYQPPMMSTAHPDVLAEHSYSGRGPGSIKDPGVNQLRRAVIDCVKAHRDDQPGAAGFLTRDWVVEHHAVARIVDELLEHAGVSE